MRKRLLSYLLRQKHEEWSRDSAQLASSEAAVVAFNELDNFAELEERDGTFIIRGSAVRWPPWCLVIRRSAGSPKLCSRSKRAYRYTHCDRGENPHRYLDVAADIGNIT